MAAKEELSLDSIKHAVKAKLRGSHEKSNSTQEVARYIRNKYGKSYIVRHTLIDRAIRELIRSGQVRKMSRQGWIQLT